MKKFFKAICKAAKKYITLENVIKAARAIVAVADVFGIA